MIVTGPLIIAGCRLVEKNDERESAMFLNDDRNETGDGELHTGGGTWL